MTPAEQVVKLNKDIALYRRTVKELYAELSAYKRGMDALFGALGVNVRRQLSSNLEYMVQCDEYPIDDDKKETA